MKPVLDTVSRTGLILWTKTYSPWIRRFFCWAVLVVNERKSSAYFLQHLWQQWQFDIFLVLMPQARHSWMWWYSDLLLCSSSQALPGWWGTFSVLWRCLSSFQSGFLLGFSRTLTEMLEGGPSAWSEVLTVTLSPLQEKRPLDFATSELQRSFIENFVWTLRHNWHSTFLLFLSHTQTQNLPQKCFGAFSRSLSGSGLMLQFFLWHALSADRPFADGCVSLQILSNQLNLCVDFKA